MKEEEKEDERSKWEEVIAAINFVAGNNGDRGGGGPVEGMVGGEGWGGGQLIMVLVSMETGKTANCTPTTPLHPPIYL